MKIVKVAKFVIPAVISAILLFILLSRFNVDQLPETFRDSDKALLLLSPVLLVVAHIFGAARWKVILEMLGARAPLKTLTRVYLANIILTKIFPLYSGDFMRTYYLRDKLSMPKHAGGIFLGMLIDVAVLSLFFLAGGVVLQHMRVAFFGGATFFLILVLFLGVSIFLRYVPRFMRDKMQNFSYAFRVLIAEKRFLLPLLGLTVANWFLVMVFVKFAFLAFGVNMPLLAIIAFQPVVILISLLPITVWGVGVRESAMLVLFSGFADGATIFAVGLTYSFVGGVLIPLLCLPLTYRLIRELSFFRSTIP